MMSGITGISQPAAEAPGIWESAAERPDRLQRSEAAAEAERTEQALGPAPLSGHAKPNMDLFVHGKESESAGLYQVSKDEEGNLQIIFDAPGQKASDAAVGEAAKAEEAKSLEQALEENEATDEEEEDKDKKGDGKTIMVTTGNSDKVEAEIKKLRQEQAKISQHMKGCSDDPDKQQEMQTQLQQIESELRVKDTKAYRDAHGVITSQRVVKGPNE